MCISRFVITYKIYAIKWTLIIIISSDNVPFSLHSLHNSLFSFILLVNSFNFFICDSFDLYRQWSQSNHSASPSSLGEVLHCDYFAASNYQGCRIPIGQDVNAANYTTGLLQRHPPKP